MIVQQADRCKKIVAGLLNFARQNKVTLAGENLVITSYSIHYTKLYDSASSLASLDDAATAAMPAKQLTIPRRLPSWLHSPMLFSSHVAAPR